LFPIHIFFSFLPATQDQLANVAHF
jgi:hypothetical protein